MVCGLDEASVRGVGVAARVQGCGFKFQGF